jgi:hypothetical protein
LQNEKIADDQSLESTLSPAPLLLQPCRSHQQDQNVPFNSFLLARDTVETYQLHESGFDGTTEDICIRAEDEME